MGLEPEVTRQRELTWYALVEDEDDSWSIDPLSGYLVAFLSRGEAEKWAAQMGDCHVVEVQVRETED